MEYNFFLSFSLTTNLSFMGCDLIGESGDPASYENKFSVRNSTNSDITVKLATGIIPHANARYDELTPIPDETYKLANPVWSAETGTHRTVKPKSHGYVYNHTPIGELGRRYKSEEISVSSMERHNRLRELMLDKLVSFTVTIRRGDTILYRVAGWDIPDDDMETYHINGKFWGYYDTKEENYFYQEEGGYAHHYPVLYTKLLPNGMEPVGTPGSVTYYIDVKPNQVSLVKFDTLSTHTRDSDFWKKH